MIADRVTADTIAAYDRIAVPYAAQAADRGPAYTAFRTRFTALLPQGGLTADLGCGPGHDLRALRRAGLRVAGLDLSIGMLALAADSPVLQADVRLPPFAPGSLDGIWSASAILHLPREELEPTLRSWRDLLKPGGVLGLGTSVGDSEGWERVGEDARCWFVHHDPAFLLAALERAGFAVLESEPRSTHRTWINLLARRAGQQSGRRPS